MSFIDPDGNCRSNRSVTSEHGVNISNTINNTANDDQHNANDNTLSSHTSNAFSYDATTSPQLEPIPHQNVPSRQNLPSPYPIPMTSLSHPILPSNIAMDPVIQQMQSSLRMMATCIDTIQETTELRFNNMQQQYEKGQQSLQDILKQGLVEMNKH